MNVRRFLVVMMTLMFAVAGCGESESAESGGGDWDMNEDGDGDTEGDGDADADADADADGGMADADADGAGGSDNFGLACSATFGEAEACGGDPSGSWILDEVCTESDLAEMLQQICATAEVGNVVFDAEGSLVVADGVFTRTTTVEAYVEAVIPVSCTFGIDCDIIATGIEAGIEGVTATCTENGQNCDCILDGVLVDESSGTYITDGGILTVDGDEYYYCSEGDDLLLSPVPEGGGQMGVDLTFVESYSK